jgi:hypothetical protein
MLQMMDLPRLECFLGEALAPFAPSAWMLRLVARVALLASSLLKQLAFRSLLLAQMDRRSLTDLVHVLAEKACAEWSDN